MEEGKLARNVQGPGCLPIGIFLCHGYFHSDKIIPVRRNIFINGSNETGRRVQYAVNLAKRLAQTPIPCCICLKIERC